MIKGFTIKKGFLFLLFTLICEEVFAGVFSVIPTDKSQMYLGMIFGGSVGAISLGGGSNNPTLSLMFEQFNFIIVSIGAVVLSYIGIISTINTAREGEAMGKKLSLWVPMRAFTGLLLMVPGPTSGYSIVQMTVIWIVLNGIGAANSVWNVVLGQLSQGIAAVGSLNIQLAPSDLYNVTNNVLQASTCMYSINSYMPELSSVPGPFQQYGPVQVYTTTATPVPDPSQTSTAPAQISQIAYVNVGLQGAPAPYNTLCGYFAVTINLDKNDPINNFNYATLTQRLSIKTAALRAMFSAVDSAAQLLATPTAIGPTFSGPDPGYAYAAGAAYISQITQLATGIKASPTANANPWETQQSLINPISGNFQQLQSYGWIHAGSYYFSMVQASTAQLDPETKPSAVLPTATMVPQGVPSLDSNGLPPGGIWPSSDNNGNSALTSLLSGKAPNYETAKLNVALQNSLNYWLKDKVTNSQSNQGIATNSPSTGNSFMDAIVNIIASYIRNPILNYISSITAGGGNSSISGSIGDGGISVGGTVNYGGGSGTQGDPLLAIGQFGTALMLAAECAVFASLVTSIALSLGMSAGSCLSPFAWGINLILMQLVPLIYGAAMIMWSAGATMGIYIPMIPYLVFTTTAFGWMIAVIEAVVGAPLIALGLTHPSGEELGQAGKALTIVANIFMRPTLMIFGFVLGASLLKAGMALVNFGFIPALNEGTLSSFFSILAVMGLYMFLMMAIVTKSFSLIHMLPNQIMRWMGASEERFEPGEMIAEAKKGFETGSKMGEEGVNTGFKSSTERMKNASDAKKKGK